MSRDASFANVVFRSPAFIRHRNVGNGPSYGASRIEMVNLSINTIAEM